VRTRYTEALNFPGGLGSQLMLITNCPRETANLRSIKNHIEREKWEADQYATRVMRLGFSKEQMIDRDEGTARALEICTGRLESNIDS
jgi:hypothetical protein